MRITMTVVLLSTYYMPGSVIVTFTLTHLILTMTHEVVILIILIVQTEKQTPSLVSCLWAKKLNSNLSSLIPQPTSQSTGP